MNENRQEHGTTQESESGFLSWVTHFLLISFSDDSQEKPPPFKFKLEMPEHLGSPCPSFDLCP